MGFIKDIGEGIQGTFDDLRGKTSAQAAEEAARIQAEAGQAGIGRVEQGLSTAQGFLSPFGNIGQGGLDNIGQLTDPQAQFDFLQNNPLFDLALQNANRTTGARAAAGSRLGAGDTLSQLSNNVLLAAQPLLKQQQGNIFGLLDRGIGVAGQQAGLESNAAGNITNLLTDIGATEAGGVVGAANAGQQGIGNILNLAGTIGGFFSDSRLKEKASIVGQHKGYDVWEWTWNELANNKFGLHGESSGVMFSDALEKDPDAVSYEDGFGKVDYNKIGLTKWH